jgi:hypothetical protein
MSGPVGPAIAGFLLVIAANKKILSTIIAYSLGGLMILSFMIWGLNSIGMVVISAIGGAIIYITNKTEPNAHVLLVHFLGIQSMLGIFRQINYLFQDTFFSAVAGQSTKTDTGMIAEYLFGSAKFWGVCLTLFSIVLLLLAFYIIYKYNNKKIAPPYTPYI